MERAVEWDVDQGKVEVRVGDRIIEGDIDRLGSRRIDRGNYSESTGCGSGYMWRNAW